MNDAEKVLEQLCAFVHGEAHAIHKIGAEYNRLMATLPNRRMKSRAQNWALYAFHKAAAIISGTGFKVHQKELEQYQPVREKLAEGGAE